MLCLWIKFGTGVLISFLFVTFDCNDYHDCSIGGGHAGCG